MRLRSWSLFVLPLLLACGDAQEPIGTAEEAVKVCPGPSTLDGLDVSHWNGSIDWAKVKASGRTFAFAKATEGTSYVDPQFATNWAGMKQNGVVRSAYHFFHANLDPIAEADHFLQVMGPLQPGDLPPTLDLEVPDGQSGATITSTAIQFLDHVAQQTGTKPILYTSPSFVTGTLGSPAGLQTHATLWIANWGVSCPDVPAPFASFTFWQTSDSGSVSGISGAVDLDTFNGTLADLTSLTVQPPGSSSSSSGGASSSGSGGVGGAGGGGGVGGGGGSLASGGGSTGDVTSTGAGVAGVGGAGGGDNGLQPGAPGCTCSMDGRDDRGAWSGAASVFALALALLGRARSRRAA